MSHPHAESGNGGKNRSRAGSGTEAPRVVALAGNTNQGTPRVVALAGNAIRGTPRVVALAGNTIRGTPHAGYSNMIRFKVQETICGSSSR